MNHRILRAALACSFVFAGITLAPSSHAHAMVAASSPVEVELTDITTELVPNRLTQGDREFGGNGPDVTCRVTLQLSSDRRKIEAKIDFKARETKSDWSTVEESFVRTVFTAPAGKTIDRIVSPTTSTVSFRSKAAGFQLLGPGEDFKKFVEMVEQIANQLMDAERTLSNRSSDTREVEKARRIIGDVSRGVKDMQFEGNHVHMEHPSSGPVSVMAIVGDTGGDDISKDRNGKDDTRIEAIMFNRVQVQYR